MTHPVRAYAEQYLELGWAALPIPFREKSPAANGADWQVKAEARRYPLDAFTGNVGVLLGTVSGGLTDVDLDCPEAVELAPFFLPPTLTFGRASAPRSHWLYHSPGCRSIDFKCAKGKREDVQVRGDKAAAEGSIGQTVFPGSTHRETGELIDFDSDASGPAEITPGELHWHAQRLAMAATILKRYREGDRHHLSLGYSGWLLNEGWTADEVRDLMAAVRACNGDTPAEEADFGHDVESTIKAMAAGRAVAGASELRSVGVDLEWSEKLTITPEKRAAQAKLAAHPSRAGQSARARVLAEAREIDDAAGMVAALAIGEAEAPEPVAGPWDGLPVAAWTDADEQPAEIDWVCRGLGIGPGKVTGLVGYANTGKTPLALLFAVCVATGKPFLGHEVRQAPVAYLALEGVRLARKRLKRICAGLGVELGDVLGKSLHFLEAMAGSLDAEFVAAFSAACEAVGAGVGVIDTYNAGVHGVDHNTPAFAEAMQYLGSHSDASGITYLALLQEKKGEEEGIQKIAGTYAMAAALQASITLTRPTDADRNTIEITCTREVEEAFQPFRVTWAGDGDEPLTCELADAKPETPQAQAHRLTDWHGKSLILQVAEACKANPAGLTKSQLRDLVSGKATKRLEAIDVARSGGMIHARAVRHRTLFFPGPDPLAQARSAEVQAETLRERVAGVDDDGGA